MKSGGGGQRQTTRRAHTTESSSHEANIASCRPRCASCRPPEDVGLVGESVPGEARNVGSPSGAGSPFLASKPQAFTVFLASVRARSSEASCRADAFRDMRDSSNAWTKMEICGCGRGSRCRRAGEGVGGLSTCVNGGWGGGGGRYSSLSLARLPQPPKRAKLKGLQNPTETDPPGPEVTRTQNSATK